MKKTWANVHLTEARDYYDDTIVTPYTLKIPFEKEGMVEVEEGIPYRVISESKRADEFYFLIELEIKHAKFTIPFIFDSKKEAIEEGWKFD